MASKPKWLGDGIFSKLRARDGKDVFYAQYWHEGKRITEKGGTTLLQAQKLRLRRLDEIDNGRFVHPGEKKQQARAVTAAELAAQERRLDLLFEAAKDRFLDRCGKMYADPKGVKACLARLGRAFKGRYMDELRRPDVLQYERDRLHNSGPFADWPRKVGPRVPQLEITMLSALYSYLIADEEREIHNPCRAPAARRHKSKAMIYRPEHKPVIANRAQRIALFRAAKDPTMRALVKLCYYTAARPESEACRILHGDVELPVEGKVHSIRGGEVLGRITYRDTKTGVDRSVPLNPKAVRSLRQVMLPRPEDGPALETWAETPIFRRADRSAWTGQSYRDRWEKALAVASKKHPGLAGMWLRDLRKTANTEMRQSGTDQATAARILGHSSEMNYRYVEATDAAAKQAILAL